jgi:hypothetical protein
MFLPVDVLGLKLDVFVVDVIEIDVLELDHLGRPDKIDIHQTPINEEYKTQLSFPKYFLDFFIVRSNGVNIFEIVKKNN